MDRVRKFLLELLFDKKVSFFAPKDDDKFWDSLVKVASKQLMIPAVYEKLENTNQLGKIPVELKNYLKNIYYVNKKRNENILIEMSIIESKLKQNGINFIFLKGASLLKTIYKKKVGVRMMHDVDLLVDENHILKAKEILNNLNYHDRGFDNILVTGKHLPILINKEKSIGVELHNLLTESQKFFNYSKIFQNNNKNLLSVKENLLHIILNTEFSDNGMLLATFNLRTMFDFYNLNKVKNNFNSLKNIYTKRFMIKMNFLGIYNTKQNYGNFYKSYLTFSRTLAGKIFVKTIKLILRLKLGLKQLLEFLINSNYRKNIMNKLKI